jgi:pyruvate ferredoxin oxidoreductase beta subunit
VETCFWPLYEVVDGSYRLTHTPKTKQPIDTWLQGQKRFAHLLEPENHDMVVEIQHRVDAEWAALLERCG